MSELDLVKLAKDLLRMQQQMTETLERLKTPAAPVSLTRAAELCEVKKDWLLERVQRQEIQGFRSAAGAPWRVYAADVVAFLTKETNLVKPRRKSMLQVVGR